MEKDEEEFFRDEARQVMIIKFREYSEKLKESK